MKRRRERRAPGPRPRGAGSPAGWGWGPGAARCGAKAGPGGRAPPSGPGEPAFGATKRTVAGATANGADGDGGEAARGAAGALGGARSSAFGEAVIPGAAGGRGSRSSTEAAILATSGGRRHGSGRRRGRRPGRFTGRQGFSCRHRRHRCIRCLLGERVGGRQACGGDGRRCTGPAEERQGGRPRGGRHGTAIPAPKRVSHAGSGFQPRSLTFGGHLSLP